MHEIQRPSRIGFRLDEDRRPRSDSPATGAAKVDPETLELRARPRPVARINRRVLVLVSGAGVLLLSMAAMFALDPPRLLERSDTPQELYGARNVPRPEGLEVLPRTYADMPHPQVELGPPLPGDIGGAVVGKERELGLEAAPNHAFRPSPEEDAARAERIRQARLAQQGRESTVFFQLASRSGGALPSTRPETSSLAAPGAPRYEASPFDVLRASRSASGLDLEIENDQNLQRRKIDFFKQGADADIYNPHALQDPASPYQVMAGTIISASLITGINSDLPGSVIAQVTENVYDTVTGRYLLIPQGSRVIGTYDSIIAFGQDRALIVWRRIIMPDGASIVIDNLPATDATGFAGLADKVDFHTWRLLKGIALSTLLGVSTELTLGDEESDLVRAIRESTQQNAGRAGQRITERNLDIQPTITIRPGWPLRIVVHSDLVLRPYRG